MKKKAKKPRVVNHRRLRRRVLAVFPTSWLDPLLTGPDAVIKSPPYRCPDIEGLITALRNHVMTILTEEGVTP